MSKGKKKRNHFFWIIGIALSWVVMEYFTKGFIDKSTFVKGLMFASVLEFGHYCKDVYLKDNEEIEIN